MLVAGIICEYNPFHLGHLGQIEKTRKLLGENCATVCVMSGNYVQRGEPAVFNKHARAAAAVSCGADLVIELPTPYALSSAERFAQAGVFLLEAFEICDAISFGSECGDLDMLTYAAENIVTEQADRLIQQWLGAGLPYALAQQKAADEIMGAKSDVFKSPNNLLAIEYLKALKTCNSRLTPITVTRTGGAHDSEIGLSAARLRKLLSGAANPWELMPQSAVKIIKNEIAAGRGPISIDKYEIAMISRLRTIDDFCWVPDATEGLDRRFAKYAAREASIENILNSIKTKRYAMSRLRRMLMCACLGITAKDTEAPPPYIRVLALNSIGKKLLRKARMTAKLPIITKPASTQKLSGRAVELFNKEVKSTDFYTLAYREESARLGGSEWRQSPYIDVSNVSN